MATAPRVLIAGGSGVFGRLLARELLMSTSARLTLAARDQARASAACRELGAPERCEAISLDLADAGAVARAVSGARVVACTAGPFQSLDPRLPSIAAANGAHWVDIGDPPSWVVRLLDDAALDAQAKAAGTVVIPGLSSTPAVSGILARWAHAQAPAADRVRITLFIGNRNEKGPAAVATALDSAFGDPVPVSLPSGRRRAYRIAASDEALVRRELGIDGEFRVAFEWRLLNRAVALIQPLMQRVSARTRARAAAAMSALGRPFSRLGDDSGLMKVEALQAGRVIAAGLLSSHGQRLAILPCALAVEALLDGKLSPRGCVSPAAWLPPDVWLARLGARGVTFEVFGQ